MAASFPFGKTKPLQPNLFRAVRLDTAFVLIKLVLVLPVVALDDRDLLELIAESKEARNESTR
jgi:hypothetical protein